MRSIDFSLAWKEWHEHKWKLVSITAILWGVAAFVLTTETSSPDRFQVAAALVACCALPFAVFVGLASAANERSRGTLPFLQALPIPMWRVAAWKLLFGIITFAMPIVLAAGFVYFWKIGPDSSGRYHGATALTGPEWYTGSMYLDMILIFTAVAGSLYVWSAAFGVNCQDEVRAGAWALSTMVGWYLLLILVGTGIYWYFDAFGLPDTLYRRIVAIGLSTAPGGFLQMLNGRVTRAFAWEALVVTAATNLTLAAWYIFRFGRIANRLAPTQPVASRISSFQGWLPPPRRWQLTAIVWKQFRESAPLAFAGLAGVVAIGLVEWVTDYGRFTIDPNRFFNSLSAVVGFIGFCTAMIVGIGVCLSDTAPDLNTFWRSRPINTDAWFWCKYVTGLVLLLVALYLPYILLVSEFHPLPGTILLSPESLVALSAHLAIFAAAVAMTCLVRHAVYAAILSIPAVYLGVAISWVAIWIAHALGWTGKPPVNLSDMSNTQVAAGFLLSFTICTPLAWLAARNDWGRKSRY